MSKSTQVVNLKITHKSSSRYWTRVTHRLDFPSIHETILESGSMIIPPIVIENGVQFTTFFLLHLMPLENY